MKEERILTLLGSVDDRYIEEAEPMSNHLSVPGRRHSRRVWIAVAVAAAFLISTFTVAFATDRRLHDTLIRFLRTITPEILLPIEDEPTQTEAIELVGSAKLDNSVSVQYIRIDGTYDYGNGIVYLYENSAPTAYIVENGQLTQLEAHSEALEYVWNDLTYSISFDYYEKNGTIYASARDFDLDTSAAWEVQAMEGRSDCVALTISYGQQIEYTQYPLLYDLNTKKIIGLLDDCAELQNRQITQTKIAPDLSGVLVFCDLGTDVYYYDVKENSLLSLNELCGKKLKDAWFIEPNTVCCLSLDDKQAYSCGRVTLSDQSYTELFSAMPKLKDDSDYGIVLTEGRYGLFVDIERNAFVYDFKTGEQNRIDNFHYPDRDTFATLNRPGSKLLFTGFDDSAEGLGISEIGVLDLQSGTFTLLDRKSYDLRREISVGWFDENTVAIQATTEEFNYLYLFTVSASN